VEELQRGREVGTGSQPGSVVIRAPLADAADHRIGQRLHPDNQRGIPQHRQRKPRMMLDHTFVCSGTILADEHRGTARPTRMDGPRR